MADPCIEAVREAIRDKVDISGLSEDELTEMINIARERRARIRNRRGMEPTPFEIAADLEQMAANEKARTQAEIYRKHLDATSIVNLREHLVDIYSDDLEFGIDAEVLGGQALREGIRQSGDLAVRNYRNDAARLVMTALSKVDEATLKDFTSGGIDADVGDVMARIEAGQSLEGTNKGVHPLARELVNVQEVMRKKANDYGLDIGKYNGYITSMSHDPANIMHAGFDKWSEFTLQRIDQERFFEGVPANERQNVLHEVWETLAFGKEMSDAVPVSTNVGRRLDRSRVLPWKDGASFAEYNTRFGAGTMYGAVNRTMRRKATAIALASKFGPDYRNNMKKAAVEAAGRVGDNNMRGVVSDMVKPGGDIDKKFDVLDGSIDIPDGRKAAVVQKVVNTIKTLNMQAMLSGSGISALTDGAYVASSIKDVGGSFVGALRSNFANLADIAGAGRRKEMADHILMLAEDQIAQYADDAAHMTKQNTYLPNWWPSTQTYFKMVGLNYITDTGARTTSLLNGRLMADAAGSAFESLDDDLRRAFTKYDIGEAEWNVFRNNNVKELADGRMYMTTDDMESLPDSVVREYLTARTMKGLESRADVEFLPVEIRKAREKLTQQLRGFFLDRSGEAVTLGTNRGRAFMKKTSGKPGSIPWVASELFWQFKGFTVNMMQGTLARELRGRSTSTTLRGALTDGNWFKGVARTVGTATALGLFVMWAKDITKNRTPRMWGEDEHAAIGSAKLIGAAFTQGGGLGIYGDFLFGELSRHGQGQLETFLGPTWGKANQAADVLGRLKGLATGDGTVGGLSSSVIRFIMSNVPFANAPVFRAMLDQTLIWQINDYMNPGYMDRMKSRLKSGSGQELLIDFTE